MKLPRPVVKVGLVKAALEFSLNHFPTLKTTSRRKAFGGQASLFFYNDYNDDVSQKEEAWKA